MQKKIVEKIKRIHLQVHETLKKSQEKYKASRMDHYIICHLSWYFMGGKIGGIGLQGPF
jgi:hypothetical protein